jgi:hypothetical protein
MERLGLQAQKDSLLLLMISRVQIKILGRELPGRRCCAFLKRRLIIGVC